MIYKKSAVQLFEKHPCLYILAFGFVSAKITNKLVVSQTDVLIRGRSDIMLQSQKE